MPDDGYFTSVGEITPRLAEDAFEVVQKRCRRAAELLGRDTVAVVLASLLSHFDPTEKQQQEAADVTQMEMFDDDR